MSQESLADRASVDRKHMSSIETGKAGPGFWTLTRIAGALGTTTSRFLSGLTWDPGRDKSGHRKKDEG